MIKETEDNIDSLSEEEAHYFHTLISFEELVREYGMEQIMETVEDDVYIQMFDFFMPPDNGEEEFES